MASIDSSLCPRTTHSSCLAQRRYEASWSPPAKTPLHVFFSIAFCSLATSRDQARAWLWLCDLGSAGIPESFFTFAPSFWRTRRWAAPFSHSRSCLILHQQPNSAEKRRECPELSKRVHPRLPNLPSPQPINLPSGRLRFTGAGCCRIHTSIWNPLPVWLGFLNHPGAYSQSLPLWITLRFKHCDHIPWFSMDLTGLSLPTWLRMKQSLSRTGPSLRTGLLHNWLFHLKMNYAAMKIFYISILK